MLYISDAAKAKVEDLKSAGTFTDAHFIRVSVTSGGCSGLTYDLDFDDQPREGDQIFEDKGIKMVTDLRSFLYVCNTTLDFSGGLDGKGFYFNNPNATRSCACGESFGV